jgi:diguanylate cyclase (GGDEF)-like protein/PAS domain S-box-containing protein
MGGSCEAARRPMLRSMRKLAATHRTWWLYGVLPAALTAAYLLLPAGKFHDILYNVAGSAALVTMVVVLARRPVPRRTPWVIFALGFGLWTAGDDYFLVMTLLGRALPAFSAMDALYFGGYALMAVGLMLLSTSRGREGADMLLDAAVVTVGVSTLVWTTFIDTLGQGAAASLLERIVSAAYPGLDIALLALVVRLVLRTRLQSGAPTLLGVGVLLSLIGDMLWRGYVFQGSYSLGSSLNALYMVGYSCFALALLHPSSRRPVALRIPTRLSRGHIVLLGLSVVAVPVAAVVRRHGSNAEDLIVLASASCMIVLLMLVRVVRMVRRAERLADEAHAATAHLDAVLETSPVPLVIIGADGLVSRWNTAAAEASGRAAASVVGRPPPLTPAGDSDRVRELTRLARSGEPVRNEEIRLVQASGRKVDIVLSSAPLLGASGAFEGVVAAWTDVTKRKRQEEQLRYLAIHDELTALPNRRVLEETLGRAVRDCTRGRTGALLLIDLDDFKLVNDSAGHQAGDRVLVRLAELVREGLRPQDLLARFGGDEFAAVLYDVSQDEARQIGERILGHVAESRFECAGVEPFRLTLSIGLCPITGEFDEHTLMSVADAALYEAKRRGRNRLVLADQGQSATVELVRANRSATKVRDALDDGTLTLFLQPIVRIADGEPEWYEALAYIVDADGSVVLPESFLPAAERFGLLTEIDQRILELVLAMVVDQPHRRVLVNIAAPSLHEDGVLRLIEDGVETIPRGAVGIEIRETTAILDLERTPVRLAHFAGLGCPIALDAFGVGFSSFARLRAWPVDYVKIPATFIERLVDDPATRAVVEAVVKVAHALGKQVIAEGVETAEVAAEVGRLKIEYGHGSLWGPAVRQDAPARRVVLEAAG